MALFSKKNKDSKDKELKEDKKQAEPSMKDLYSDKDSSSKELKTEKVTAKKSAPKAISAYKVLIKPLVTEKAANLSATNQYVFMVAKEANKIEVAKAVYEVYKIKPLGVNIVNNKGKRVRRGRQVGKRKDWKKAIVSLPAGKTLNIYEGV